MLIGTGGRVARWCRSGRSRRPGSRPTLKARRGLQRRIRTKLDDWRGLLTRNVDAGRDVLRALLMEPLRFTPIVKRHERAYRFTGAIALDRLVAGAVDLPALTGVASPGEFAPGGNPFL